MARSGSCHSFLAVVLLSICTIFTSVFTSSHKHANAHQAFLAIAPSQFDLAVISFCHTDVWTLLFCFAGHLAVFSLSDVWTLLFCFAGHLAVFLFVWCLNPPFRFCWPPRCISSLSDVPDVWTHLFCFAGHLDGLTSTFNHFDFLMLWISQGVQGILSSPTSCSPDPFLSRQPEPPPFPLQLCAFFPLITRQFEGVNDLTHKLLNYVCHLVPSLALRPQGILAARLDDGDTHRVSGKGFQVFSR